MGFMPMKKRTKEEVEEMLIAHAQGATMPEISQRFSISEGSFCRILRVNRGLPADSTGKKTKKKVERLERQLKERDREIELLKAALKKS